MARPGASASAPSRRVSADGSADTLQLTPASHGTDGFFIALLGSIGLSVGTRLE